MSKVTEAFSNSKAFIPFLTAGDPNIEKTENYILELEKAGADLIEIGIPFSDPIAEGVVIQEADLRSLKAGTTTDKIFDMVASVRKKTDIPLVFMTYLNPVFHYGYEPVQIFCRQGQRLWLQQNWLHFRQRLFQPLQSAVSGTESLSVFNHG